MAFTACLVLDCTYIRKAVVFLFLLTNSMSVNSFPLIKWDLPKNEDIPTQQTQDTYGELASRNEISKCLDKRLLEEPSSEFVPKRIKYSEEIAIKSYSDTVFQTGKQNLLNNQTSYSDSFIGNITPKTIIDPLQEMLPGRNRRCEPFLNLNSDLQKKDNFAGHFQIKNLNILKGNEIQKDTESFDMGSDNTISEINDDIQNASLNEAMMHNQLFAKTHQQSENKFEFIKNNDQYIENEFSFLQYKIYDKDGDFVNSSYNENRNLEGNEGHKVIFQEEKLLKRFPNSDDSARTNFSSMMAITLKLSMECEELTKTLTKEMSLSDSSLPICQSDVHLVDSPLPFRTNDTDINMETINFASKENEIDKTERIIDNSIIEIIKNIKTLRVKSEEEYITPEIREKYPLTIKDFVW